MTSTVLFTRPEALAIREAWARRNERVAVARQAAEAAERSFQAVLVEVLGERGMRPPFQGNIETDREGCPVRFVSRDTPAAMGEGAAAAPPKKRSHPS